jgi:hypothetical protein
LIVGFVRGRAALGVVGLVVSAIGGLILGLILALPIAVVFTLAIVLYGRERMHPTHA